MLPGVPREMRGMLADELIPRLRARLTPDGTVVRSRTLRTTGIGESSLADRLGDLAGGVEALPMAYMPAPEGVDLRLTARGVDGPVADQMLAAPPPRPQASPPPTRRRSEHSRPSVPTNEHRAA